MSSIIFIIEQIIIIIPTATIIAPELTIIYNPQINIIIDKIKLYIHDLFPTAFNCSVEFIDKKEVYIIQMPIIILNIEPIIFIYIMEIIPIIIAVSPYIKL